MLPAEVRGRSACVPRGLSMAHAIRRFAVSVLLAGFFVLMAASASVANPTQSGSTTTTTTLPAPHLAQSSLLFKWSGDRFSDVVLVNIPNATPTEFFLSLAPDTQTIKCTASANASPQSLISHVTSFNVLCEATSLPPIFAPTLEVLVPSAQPAFIPVTLLNNLHKRWLTWLPLIVGALLAAIVLIAAVWTRKRSTLSLETEESNRHKREWETDRSDKSFWKLWDLAINPDLQAWNASDCWVTNVGAAVTILTPIIHASL